MGSRGPKPPDLDDPRVKAILQALNAGNYVEHALEYAGVGKRTYYDWLDRGKAEAERLANGETPNPVESTYVAIYEEVSKARAAAVVRNIALIQQAANAGTWQAAAWWLERTMPQKFGRRLAAEVSGPDGGPVEMTVTPETLNAKIAALIGEDNEGDND